MSQDSNGSSAADGKSFGSGSDLPHTQWGWGRKQLPPEIASWSRFPWSVVYLCVAGIPFLLLNALGFGLSWFSLITYVILAVLLVMPSLAGCLVAFSYFEDIFFGSKTAYDGRFVTVKDASLKEWTGAKVPIEPLSEAYFVGKVDIGDPDNKGDLLTALYRRHSFARFVFTPGHIRTFLLQILPELIVHSRKQDTDQVTDHYDRGNDFYNWFLGETMVYTSGIFHNENDSLELAQANKINLVLNKIHLKKGMDLLDIGCGWGTLCLHAARDYGVTATGVTLSKEQTTWAHDKFKAASLKADQARVLTMDYRDIPAKQYDRITCLEMAEHVGVRLFGKFLRQVSSMLKDDGIFYLQIAGLRRPWQFEDLQWGLFMGKYVFPGADASCPLGWVIDQLEGNGFEVRSVETVGVHYSATIKRWYDNWKKNEKKILSSKYKDMYRKWLWFLAWSTIIAEQGSATCYQIVCHKNRSGFVRQQFIAERANWKV